MKWSFRIATVAGTEVRIHATFFLLLLFFAMQGMENGGGVSGALSAVLLVTAMFTCVLLHEFGHVLAARMYGIRTPDITLLPIGGLARLERMPRKPSQELVVAICGPLVNVAIALMIAAVLGTGTLLDASFDFGADGAFWQNLMRWNLMMVVFNMIPAFPMDGGRVLRALLAMMMDYGKATRAAAGLGQGLAVIAFLWMLLFGAFNPFLMLITFFIFIAAGQEAAMVSSEEATRDLFVRDAMLTDFRVLREDATLQNAVDFLLSGSQQDFPLIDDREKMMGMLKRKRLIAALAEHDSNHGVLPHIESCEVSAGPDDVLAKALESLQSSSCGVVPVIDPMTGRLVGLLTPENIGEMLMVRAALMRK